jgi:chemotaxis protein MotA
MYYLMGVVVSFICFITAILTLKQDLGNYYDDVGFLVVIGGTVSTAIMTFPWRYKKEIGQCLKHLIAGKELDFKVVNQACFEMVKNSRNGVTAVPQMKGESLAKQVLNDGVELIQLGFLTAKIEKILDERIYQYLERKTKVSTAFRSLAKYPPAFGLVGTVLGLVSLMRSLSAGSGSEEIGIRMSIALVATLYGLVTANLMLNPAGERIHSSIADEKKAAELALKAVVLAADQVSLLEAQEVLNSYVKLNERINGIGDMAA